MAAAMWTWVMYLTGSDMSKLSDSFCNKLHLGLHARETALL